MSFKGFCKSHSVEFIWSADDSTLYIKYADVFCRFVYAKVFSTPEFNDVERFSVCMIRIPRCCLYTPCIYIWDLEKGLDFKVYKRVALPAYTEASKKDAWERILSVRVHKLDLVFAINQVYGGKKIIIFQLNEFFWFWNTKLVIISFMGLAIPTDRNEIIQKCYF